MPAIAGEAWRNVASGATRALWLGLTLLVVCGGLAVVQARLVVGLVGDALAYRNSGAATWVGTLNGAINGAQCDALASLPGVVAAGALRADTDITFAALPSSGIQAWDVTPGFVGLFDRQTRPSTPDTGVWLTSDVATRLGVSQTTPSLPLADGSAAALAGVFDYPNDGRLPTLNYSVVTPVSAIGAFDQCWVEAWPNTDVTASVMPLAALPTNVTPGSTPAALQTVQLNTTRGQHFDGTAQYAALPLAALAATSFGVAALVGFLGIRLRRLELATVLHAGWTKSAVTLQVLVETLMWATVGIVLAATPALYAARLRNTADFWPAYFPVVRSLGLALVGALLGSLAAVALTRERHLYRYFKHR